MIKIKDTGEKVVIIKVIYHDTKVVINGREMPVVLQYMVADPKGKWTDYVSPEELEITK